MKNQRLSIRRARLSTPENQKQNPFDVIEPSSAMQSQGSSFKNIPFLINSLLRNANVTCSY